MKKDKMYGFRFLRFVLGIIFKLYYNPKIVNKEYIPKDGSILVVGNHKHLFDQCLPIISTKRPIHYMAKKEYFDDKKVSWFFKLASCIPVDRAIKDDKATNAALKVLKNGNALGLFPEGTRNKTNKTLLPFKYGAVSMAHKTNSYLVPFAITGEYKFRSKDLTVTFGKPYKVKTNDLDKENKKLEKTILNLLKSGK